MTRRLQGANLGLLFLLAFSGVAWPLPPLAAQTGAAPGKVPVTPERLLADYSSITSQLPTGRWQPDSKHLVFLTPDGKAGPEGRMRVVTVDAESGKSEQFPVSGSNPKLSPDGSKVAYLAGEKKGAELWVMLARGGNPKRLGQAGGGPIAPNFSWSPDSQKIAYVAGEKEEAQLWVVSLEEEKAEPVTRLSGSPTDSVQLTTYRPSSDLVWSPDSRRIAYAYRPAPPVKVDKQKDGKPPLVAVIGEEGDVPPDSELWCVNLESRSRQKLLSGPYQVENLTWFPDGKSLLFTATVFFEYKDDKPFQEVRAVSVPDGQVVRVLIKDRGMRLSPSLSPEGRQIAFTADLANLPFPYFHNVAVVPAQGGPIRQLTRDIFVNPGVRWSPDGTRVYFLRKAGAFSQISFVTPSGEVKQLTRAARNPSAISPSPDGRYVAWTTQDAQGKADIRVARSDGQDERVLFDLTPEVKTFALGQAEEVRWKSRDGLEIAGLLIRPVGYEPGRKYPLLVDLHGGPVGGVYLRGSILMSSPLEWHLWAARGFAVFFPDYRSSAIYGWDQVLTAREKQDANDRDFDDIMSGVDHVIKTGIVDTGRMALIGHSYGAVLTNWIIPRTNRFKVAVSYEGVAEMYLAYGVGTRVGGNSIAEWLFKGKPWDVPENYRRNSMVEDVKSIKTPTLFISGDKSIPLYHNEFLYTALKKQGVDARMLVYKDESHVIQRPENQRDLLMRVLDWVESHLK